MNTKIMQKLHELADRGRHGDQNALAMIEEVRKNAHGGVQKAQESLKVLLAYLHANPIEPVAVSAETGAALSALREPNLDPQNVLRILCFLPHCGDPGAMEAACVILAGGLPMSTDRVATLDSQVIPPLKPPFHFGLERAGDDSLFGNDGSGNGFGGEGDGPFHNPDPTSLGYISAGHCIGIARRLQQVRGGAPFEMLSPELSWELDLGAGHRLPPPSFDPPRSAIDPRYQVDPRQGLEINSGFADGQGYPEGQFPR